MTDEQAQATLQRIAHQHYVTVERMLGPARDRFTYAARQAAAHALAQMGFNSVQIGKYLNRDPSTVLNMLGTLTKSKKRAVQ